MSIDVFSFTVLSASVLLQLIAAVLALCALPYSARYRYPWILLSLALLFMVERRAVPLYSVLHGGSMDLFIELIGLVISTFMVISLLGLRHLLLAVREKEEQLTRLAVTDNLTGLDNRSQVLEKLKGEIARSDRNGAPLSILILDIDFFKRVNDEHGHMTGDDVLVASTARCAAQLRNIDMFGRLGGEEFLIVLPGTGTDEAAAAAERIRKCFTTAPIQTEKGPFPITVSIGLTTYTPSTERLEEHNPESITRSLLLHADLALYQAKSEGRNCIRIWQQVA